MRTPPTQPRPSSTGSSSTPAMRVRQWPVRAPFRYLLLTPFGPAICVITNSPLDAAHFPYYEYMCTCKVARVLSPKELQASPRQGHEPGQGRQGGLKLKVLLADAHLLTVQGIMRALEGVDDIDVVGEARSGR